MVKEVLEKYGDKLSIWLRENPIYILFIGMSTSTISYGLIGNFILHTESWLNDPLKLVVGLVTVPVGFHGTLLYNRLFLRVNDEEEMALAQEIVAAVLILPVFMVWAPIHILKDTLGGGSE